MKKLLIITLSLIAVLVIGLLIARQVAIGYLTPDFLVRKIESSWNCRAEVQSLDVSLLGTASVDLRGVALAPRDAYADNQTPLADRPPIEDSLIRSESVLLNVKLADLLARRLNIALLQVGQTDVTGTVFSDGSSDLEKLFVSPAETESPQLSIVAAPESPADETTLAPPPGLVTVAVQSPETPSTDADIPLSTVADSMELENATVSLLLEASGARLLLENLKLRLTEIDINPKELDQQNRAVFVIESDLAVKNAEMTEEYLLSHLSGTGEIFPFDAATGEMNPSWVCTATMHQGARINTFPVVEKINELLANVDAGGVDLGDFQLSGELLSDATTRISAKDGRMEFETPLELDLADAGVTVREQSWVDTGSNQHQIHGVIIASQEMTDDIEAKLAVYLQKKTGGFLNSENLVDLVLGPVKKDDRLAFNFSSKGDLSEPDADILTPFGNLSEVMDEGKKTLKDLENAGKALLQGLFGK